MPRRSDHRPVTDEERDFMLADMREGMSRNAIARKYGRASGTVTDVAREHGHVFDRSQTELARAARQLDVKEAQEKLAKMFLERGIEALEAMDGRYEITQWSPPSEFHSGEFVTTSVEPSPRDLQNYMTTAAIGMQRARELLATGVNDDQAAARSMLTGIRDGLDRIISGSVPADDDPTRMPD